MRVLHLPVGRQMIEMCEALRSIGVRATSCHFRQRSVPQHPDRCLHLERLSRRERLQAREQWLSEAVQRYDVFHFHFGQTFFEDHSDLRYLKRHGKKLIVQHRGSDVRMLSVARTADNPHVRVKSGRRRSEEAIQRELHILSGYIDHAIVADHELLAYIKPYYKHIHLLRQSVTLSKFLPAYPALSKTRPLILHAPTHEYVKGTEYVLKAVARLKARGFDFEFELVQDLTHEAAIARYRQADIIIDQLLQGSCGVFSLEGMALGKPVVCYIKDELLPTYPSGLPLISASPANIYSTLKRLIRHPELRSRAGRAGRRYIEQYYDAVGRARELKKIYDQL
ncbi:glycosyltransferase family protein [Paenibacillus daejeonensis]|uniref:glycosyltransferase family protein n=1 Tax=Paenibacillus daejeonensis TaxID=135193 RepID=UPI0003815BE9|nr:glycosyltransferase [Paenibacillus daejeonensis]